MAAGRRLCFGLQQASPTAISTVGISKYQPCFVNCLSNILAQICIDESMSRWYGKGGDWINEGLPHYVAIDRKPENGCEIQTACCGTSGIMMSLLESRRRRTQMKMEKWTCLPLFSVTGTVSILYRLVQISHTVFQSSGLECSKWPLSRRMRIRLRSI